MKNHLIASVKSRRRSMPPPSAGAALILGGITQKEWHASGWVPTTVQCVIPASTPAVLITLGGWWDSARGTSSSNRPQDRLNNGANQLMPAIYNQSIPNQEDPVKIQFCMLQNAQAGTYTITPPNVGSQGDGWILAMHATGINPNVAPRDKGRVRNHHNYVGIPDPNSIQAVTVNTDSTLAQVGDLAIAMFVMDNEESPNINAQIPAGWTLIGKNNVVIENVGYAACYKIVTTPGQQSATFTWTDNSTNVVEAAIMVLAKA